MIMSVGHRMKFVFLVAVLLKCGNSQNTATTELYIPGRSASPSDATLTASLIGGSGSPTSTFLLNTGGGGSSDQVPLTLVEAATTAQLTSTQTAEGFSEVDIIDCQISSDTSNCVATRITSDSSGLATATFGFAEVVSSITVVAVGLDSSPTTVDTTTSPTPSSDSSSPTSSPSLPSSSPSATSDNTPLPGQPTSSATSPAPTSNMPNTLVGNISTITMSSGVLPSSVNVNSARRSTPFGLLFLSFTRLHIFI